MGVPTSEVGYTSAMHGREDYEVHKGHVVALGGRGERKNLHVKEELYWTSKNQLKFFPDKYRPSISDVTEICLVHMVLEINRQTLTSQHDMQHV